MKFKQFLSMRYVFYWLLLLFFLSCSQSDPYQLVIEKDVNFPWSDSVIRTLSPEERIAQLIFIRSFPASNSDTINKVLEKICQLRPGGVIFFKGNSFALIQQVKLFDSISNVPLFYGIDAEQGVGMRLTDVVKIADAQMLGSANNDSLAMIAGRITGKQMNCLGLHINFAPVCDINEVENKIIKKRSFGSNPENVSLHATHFYRGLKSQGILSVAKHFPGHGSTINDSHENMPIVTKTKDQMNGFDLIPFQKLIADSIEGVMIAHLLYSNISRNVSTVDSIIITNWLKQELCFNGLVFSDALSMKALDNIDDVEIKALKAGIDILLFPRDAQQAIKQIMIAIKRGEISMSLIDQKCLKVLHSKEKYAAIDRRANNFNVDDLYRLNTAIDSLNELINNKPN